MIGREPEKEFMLNLLDTENAEMLAVFGRRRVGKTYLIKTVYKEHLSLCITGIQDCHKDEQTKTKKQLFTTLITTYGINHNENSLGLIDNVMILDDLFVPNPKF